MNSAPDGPPRSRASLASPSHSGSPGYVLGATFVAALGGLLFGYDTAVISGAIGSLQTHFELTAAMQGWAASSALAGCVVGVSFCGGLSDGLGRKKVMLLAAVLFLVSAIGTALPQTFTEFVVFRLLGGVGVGIASMTSPMYIAEVSPARLRGRLVSINQLAIVTGMIVVYFVNYFIARQGNESWNVTTGWRWMFGSGAGPSVGFLAALFFVPESPRWLVKQGRVDDALHVLSRIGGEARAQAELAEIRETLAQEGGSVWDLFQPAMRVVLLIAVGLAVLQQVTGINVFLYYAPEIFKKISHAGSDVALLQTVVVGAVNMLFTFLAIGTVDRVGRKPLMLIGAAGMGLCLVAMGLAAYVGSTGAGVLVFVLGYIACFAMSVGPVTWVILSEIFPTKIRGRAMSLATFCLWTANFVVSQTFPMMDQNEWLVARFHQAFPFWIYALMCVIQFVFVWRLVPETKGQSLEQIERIWRH